MVYSLDILHSTDISKSVYYTNPQTSTSKMKMLSKMLLALAAIVTTLSTSQAAVITWGSATTIVGDTDVSTAGDFVSAFNVSGANTTINGVAFVGANMAFNTSVDLGGLNQVTLSGDFPWNDFTGFGNAAAPFSALSTQYQSLLSTGTFPNFFTNLTVTYTDLTPGYTYQAQVWVNDSRGVEDFENNAQSITGGPTLNSNFSLSPGGLGQYAIGTFVADALTQDLIISPGNNSLYFNATQLRLTAVPEPATIGLLGGALGFLEPV